MPSTPGASWVDGALRPAGEGPDGALRAGGRACFSTARVTGGRTRWLERHVERLCRDARALGLGTLDPSVCETAFRRIAAAAFPDGDGVVRVQASRGADGGLHLVAIARPLPPDRGVWTAVRFAGSGGGARAGRGAKVRRPLHERAGAHARAAGADEAVLVDAAGRLVEGAISNLFAVGADGRPRTPPLERGGVDGLARRRALALLPETRVCDVRHDEPLRELIATNAVRGARAIVALDGRPVGDGRPGPVARRLTELLAGD